MTHEMRLSLISAILNIEAFGRLVIAQDDIKRARETALLILNRTRSVQDEFFDPLSCATVIWYARPFVSSDEAPGIPGKFERFRAKAHRDLHARLILQTKPFHGSHGPGGQRSVPHSQGVSGNC
jgi:hypothetical protein